MVGKDILRFHAVYWPAFLMSAGIAPPLGVFAHGWWTVEGQKMSKSLGNVVDPYEMVRKYGADAFRYFLLREVSFGLDGDFSEKELIKRANSELADKLGNLLNRSLGMLGKYFAGVVPAPGPPKPRGRGPLRLRARDAPAVAAAMDEVAFHKALAAIIELVTKGNEYVQSTQPWTLAKDPAKARPAGDGSLQRPRGVPGGRAADDPVHADRGAEAVGSPRSRGRTRGKRANRPGRRVGRARDGRPPPECVHRLPQNRSLSLPQALGPTGCSSTPTRTSTFRRFATRRRRWCAGRATRESPGSRRSASTRRAASGP